jgi:hypothetical protein
MIIRTAHSIGAFHVMASDRPSSSVSVRQCSTHWDLELIPGAELNHSRNMTLSIIAPMHTSARHVDRCPERPPFVPMPLIIVASVRLWAFCANARCPPFCPAGPAPCSTSASPVLEYDNCANACSTASQGCSWHKILLANDWSFPPVLRRVWRCTQPLAVLLFIEGVLRQCKLRQCTYRVSCLTSRTIDSLRDSFPSHFIIRSDG